jgi:hypothetical protein
MQIISSDTHKTHYYKTHLYKRNRALALLESALPFTDKIHPALNAIACAKPMRLVKDCLSRDK